jgi:putative resolvase
VNLTEWARAQGIHPQMACRWFREGTLPVPAVRVNQRTVLASPDAPAGPAASSYGLHARVSLPGQKAGLDRQVARLTWRAAGAGGRVVLAGAEAGSSMNGSRARVRRLLADPNVNAVLQITACAVLEHRS